MRSLRSLAWTLTIAASAAVVATAQLTPPPTKGKAAGPPTCYELKPFEIPGETHRWARVQTGDEWLTGCVGPDGRCFTTYWAPC